jgi:hypothetical protein
MMLLFGFRGGVGLPTRTVVNVRQCHHAEAKEELLLTYYDPLLKAYFTPFVVLPNLNR